MRERDGIGVEDLPSEPARVHKPGVLRRARERICSAQGRIGVCFVMVVLALFILWPLSLALTAAAQGPLPQRESLGPALAPDPDLPYPTSSRTTADTSPSFPIPRPLNESYLPRRVRLDTTTRQTTADWTSEEEARGLDY